MADELIAQAKEIEETSLGDDHQEKSFKVPSDVRKSKVAHVMGLLEREYVALDEP